MSRRQTTDSSTKGIKEVAIRFDNTDDSVCISIVDRDGVGLVNATFHPKSRELEIHEGEPIAYKNVIVRSMAALQRIVDLWEVEHHVDWYDRESQKMNRAARHVSYGEAEDIYNRLLSEKKGMLVILWDSKGRTIKQGRIDLG